MLLVVLFMKYSTKLNVTPRLLTSCCNGHGTVGTFSAALRWPKSRQLYHAAEQCVSPL